MLISEDYTPKTNESVDLLGRTIEMDQNDSFEVESTEESCE